MIFWGEVEHRTSKKSIRFWNDLEPTIAENSELEEHSERCLSVAIVDSRYNAIRLRR